MDTKPTIFDRLRSISHPLIAKEAAELLGLHPQTLYKWSRTPGRVPCYRVGGALRFDPAALAEWIDGGSM